MSATRPLSLYPSPSEVHEKNRRIIENHIRVRLRSHEPEIFIQEADKLSIWLSRSEAYYEDIRPLIVSMLETAMETMMQVLSLRSGQTFHISLCTSEQIKPRANAYRNLVATVKPFFEKFREEHLKRRLIEVFSTIYVSAEQPSRSSIPTPYPSIFPAPTGTETVSPIRSHVPRETLSTETPQALQTSRRGPPPATNLIRSIPAIHNLQQQQILHLSPQPFAYPPRTGQRPWSSSNAGPSQQGYILPPLTTNSQTTIPFNPLPAYSFSVPMPYTPTIPLHTPGALGTTTRSPSQLIPPQSFVSHVSLSPIDTPIPSASSRPSSSSPLHPPKPASTSSASSISTGKPKTAKSLKPMFDKNMLRTLAAKDKSHWSKHGKEKSTTSPVGEKTATPPERGTPKDFETAGQGMEIEKVSEGAQKDIRDKNTIPTATERQQLQVELIHVSEAGVNMIPPLSGIKTFDGQASGTAPVLPSMPSGVEPFRPALAPPGDEGLMDVSKEAAGKSEPEAVPSPKSQDPVTENKVIPSQVEFRDMDQGKVCTTPPIRVLETDDEMEVDEMINDETCTDKGVLRRRDKEDGIREKELRGTQGEDAAGAIEMEAANVLKEQLGTLEVIRDSQLSSSNSPQAQQIVSPLPSTEPLESSQVPDTVDGLALSLKSIALSNPSIVEEFEALYATGFPLDLSRRWRPSTGPAHVNGTIQEQESRATLPPDLQTIRARPLPPLTLQDYQPNPPYQVITAIGGKSSAGSYSIEFELGEEQLTFTKRWVDRRDGFEYLPCMCISISCHPIMDDMPELEEGMTLESLVDLFTKEAYWPKDGLQIIVEADGSTGIECHASSLPYLKTGEPIDLTSLIGRHNKVTFCHTQDHTKFVFLLRAHKPTVAQMRALDELTPGTEAWNAIFKLTIPTSWGRALFFASKSPADYNSVSMDVMTS